jgi:hypothetical protein
MSLLFLFFADASVKLQQAPWAHTCSPFVALEVQTNRQCRSIFSTVVIIAANQDAGATAPMIFAPRRFLCYNP